MFSVLLPVYNGERWLGEAIQSVMDQTFKEFECLILCNGCTDSSADIATEMTADDDRFVVHKLHLANKANALNFGVCFSKHHWLAPIDADDKWLPEKLQTQYNFISQNPAVDIIGTQLDYFGTLECAAPRNPCSHDEIYECYSRGKNPLPFPSVVYKKNVHLRGVGFFNTSHFVIEDYDFWQRCRHSGMIMVNLPNVLLHYRIHGNAANSRVKDQKKQDGGVTTESIQTDSIVTARQTIAKAITDAMYVSCDDVEKMPTSWGLIGFLRKFDRQYPKGDGTPVNSTDNMKVDHED